MDEQTWLIHDTWTMAYLFNQTWCDTLIHATTLMILKNIRANENKPDKKGHILFDSNSRIHPE